MKKGLIILLSLTMLLGVGCSNSNEGKENGENETAINEVVEGSNYFGKVEKVVGNELQLTLAKNSPIIMEGKDGEVEGGSLSFDSGEGDIGGEKKAIISEATGSVSSTDGIDGQVGSMRQEIIDGDKNKMELEYTGESKSLIIPAGATIFDSRNGKEIKMSDIKDGSVIMVYTKTSGDSEVVFQVNIME